ncbi:DUF1540 domain-containing protein [Microbulbifer flavimaris]|uniref:DUF1540 domain-containing protein n=2 Tax=Microbulbiferaceae TaxID=1706373 RepID=A0ABX4HX20_9GAMM|nr:hypothetical protein AVO43_11665 [Microbulbifer sp. ZGT114]PCO04670.1 DUF1540 domain-containing protein [Microbulbifer flavimaris]
MIIATDMPEVAQCAISQCAYNTDNNCHARAITIGHGDIPGCDTYFNNSKHTRSNRSAGVGACKVSACDHNEDFECCADSINVGEQGGEVRCMTCSCN